MEGVCVLLLAAYASWKKVYEDLADGFGAKTRTKPDWGLAEKDMLAVIELEKLLAVERATVEKGTPQAEARRVLKSRERVVPPG